MLSLNTRWPPTRAGRFLAAAALALLALRAHAVCLYQREAHAIWIYDYSEDLPARPQHLLFFDRINNWGLVSHDAARDTYTVNANLWIGRNDGSDTVFQLGAPDRTNETLVLNGNLVIYPARIAGENPPGYIGGVHRLSLGRPDWPGVRARLLFDNAPGRRHTLHTGAYYRERMTGAVSLSGQLRVYGGTLSAAAADRPMYTHLYMYLAEVILDRAVLSRCAGTLAYGAGNGNYSVFRVTDSVFEHADGAVSWGRQTMTGAVFRNLETALGGANIALTAILTDCQFQDNGANWSLAGLGGGRLFLVDCDIQPPLKGNRYPARATGAPDVKVLSSRHVRVRVVDAGGRPVPGARVEARCEPDAGRRVAAVTGTDGWTPGRGAPDPLLLDEWEETPGLAENQPERREFQYTLGVAAPRPAAVPVSAFQPTQSWAEITLALRPAP